MSVLPTNSEGVSIIVALSITDLDIFADTIIIQCNIINNVMQSNIIIVILLLCLFVEVGKRSTLALLVVILYTLHAFSAIHAFVVTRTFLTIAQCVICICDVLKLFRL